MDINRNKTFNFVPVNKENNYYDLSYEINNIEIFNPSKEDIDMYLLLSHIIHRIKKFSPFDTSY